MRQGQRSTVGGVTVISLASSEPTVRVGFVTGRRLGNATTRNRIKRRLRHACRQIDFVPGWDHVVIPTRAAERGAFPTLVEWLRVAVRRG
jgi:ribonuclease P protein component